MEEEEINYSYLPDLVGHLLGLAHARVTQLYTDIMELLDLTPRQFVTLEFVSKNPNIAQKDIAFHMGTSPTVLVSILDTLTNRKLVKRRRSTDDRRRQFVQVTEKGKGILDAVREKAFEVEDIFAAESELSKTEREILLKLLQKVANRQVKNKVMSEK